MASDLDRLKQLSTASAFCLFDRRLRSSGNGSIIWGVLNLALGGLSVASGHLLGVVSVFLGIALIVAGVYERKVRDPKVIVLSTITLAILALWNFALIGLAAMGSVHLALGAKTLYWAIAQAFGAYATWKTYAAYKILRTESDPLAVQQVHGYIDELKKAKPGQSMDLIEFDMSGEFLQATKRYRLKPVEDLYLAARYKVELGSMSLEEVIFVPRNEVALIPEGEKWMSKKIKASIQLGALKLEKVTITPEMAARINPTVGVMALGPA